MTLSVVVTTYDSAATLDRCLASVAWADERIVVDGGSRDATCAIARAAGARVIAADNPPMLNVNKNRGMDAARGRWLLSLDSDESLSPALAGEVRAALAADPDVAAFWLRRRHVVLGHVLRGGPWGEDRQLRLLRRDAGRFACRDIHELIAVDGPVATLDGALWHHRPAALREYRRRILHYSRHRARRYVAEGRPLRWWKVLGGPPRVVLDALVWRGGLIDGPIGVYMAAMLGLESLCDHLYHAELRWRGCGSSS